MRRNDLSLPRPWKAKPMDGLDSGWGVTAPMRYSVGETFIACALSEEDARTIEVCHAAMDLIGAITQGASLDEIRKTAIDITRAYEGFDPIAEDEEHLSRGE